MIYEPWHQKPPSHYTCDEGMPRGERMTYRWIEYPNVVVLEDDDEPARGSLATITWNLPVGDGRGRLRLAGRVIRSPKEAFWRLADAKDMALAAAEAWSKGADTRGADT